MSDRISCSGSDSELDDSADTSIERENNSDKSSEHQEDSDGNSQKGSGRVSTSPKVVSGKAAKRAVKVKRLKRDKKRHDQEKGGGHDQITDTHSLLKKILDSQ